MNIALHSQLPLLLDHERLKLRHACFLYQLNFIFMSRWMPQGKLQRSRPFPLNNWVFCQTRTASCITTVKLSFQNSDIDLTMYQYASVFWCCPLSIYQRFQFHLKGPNLSHTVLPVALSFSYALIWQGLRPCLSEWGLLWRMHAGCTLVCWDWLDLFSYFHSIYALWAGCSSSGILSFLVAPISKHLLSSDSTNEGQYFVNLVMVLHHSPPLERRFVLLVINMRYHEK